MFYCSCQQLISLPNLFYLETYEWFSSICLCNPAHVIQTSHSKGWLFTLSANLLLALALASSATHKYCSETSNASSLCIPNWTALLLSVSKSLSIKWAIASSCIIHTCDHILPCTFISSFWINSLRCSLQSYNLGFILYWENSLEVWILNWDSHFVSLVDNLFST